MTRPRFRPVICVILAVLIVFTGIPVSAMEITTAAPILGEVSGVGDVQIGGNHVASASLTSGDRIRTGDSSSAKLVLLDGSKIELSSRADLTINSTGPEIRLRLTSGSMTFDAANASAATAGNHLAIAVGHFEILPEGSSSGSIAITAIQDGNQAALQVLTGNVKLYDSEEKSNVVVPAGTVHIALNFPPPTPDAPSQDLAQAPPAPPAQRPANLPTTDPGQQPPASRPKPGGKTLPIILGAGGGAALGVILAAKGSSSDETPTPCGPTACPPSPSISTLTPNSAIVGAPVTISGSSFGSTQGAGTLRFSGIAAAVSSWSDTSIVASVPAGAASGSVVVTTAAGGSSNDVAFTVNPPTSITGLSPVNGPVGTSVTIAGANFGVGPGSSTVTFAGAVATTIISWTATSIVAVVPGGAATGNVVVTTTTGGPSNGLSFTVIGSPTLTTLIPGSGIVGSLVTLTGSAFGATQGTNTVRFNGTTATSIGSWSDTSIVAAVPAGASTGNVVVTTAAGASNGLQFTVIGAPVLTTLTPGSGIVGSLVSIAGSGFGATQGNSTLTFSGIAAAINSWSGTSIVAAVPAGATSGNVVVTTIAGAGNALTFTVIAVPVLATLTPSSGIVGSLVSITGSGFGATRGNSTVTFNGTAATSISSWSDTSMAAVVPAGATSGNVVVTTAGGSSNAVFFTVNSATAITSLSPNSGVVGGTVTITGTGFGATQGAGTVTFNGTAATSISNWSDTSIAAVVPAGATSGNVLVSAAGGPSNGAFFTVNLTTTITNLSPNSGVVGGTVTITGAGFGATQGASTVTFNGTAATSINNWSDTSIAAGVPAGAASGNVVVTTTAGGPSNGAFFTVNPTTTITSLSPNSGVVGGTVTITGTSFGGTQGTSLIAFNGTAATSISSWSDTSIVAVVPAGATTGNVVMVTTAGGSSNGMLFTVNTATFITSLSPDSGVVGGTVRITGASFGGTQGTSTVTFNGTTATSISNWADTSIDAVVPAGATTGSVVVFTTAGGPSNGVVFTVTAAATSPPTIANLSPINGPEGATVTIGGTSFGGTQGSSTVTFNGTTVTSIGNWSDTSIAAVVPAGATSGDVVVTTSVGPSNGVGFSVDSSGMLVAMSVDHAIASPGDSVVFSFSASNPGDAPLSVASLNNTLPAGFAFTTGSAIIQLIGSNGEESIAQAITPIVSSDGLVFPIGALAARVRILIRYSAVVLSDAHPGEHRSGVTGIANVLSGKRVNSSPAQVRVTVTAGAFSLNQVLIGRVFEDRNTNGSYDSGEPGVANVRVVSSSGQTATTDSDGKYNLPSVAAGSLLVGVDPSTLPPGFDLPPGESRLGGAGRLLRTPLEGGGLLMKNFALIRIAGSIPADPTASSHRNREDAGNGGKTVRLEMVIERPVMTAGAYDKQLIRIRALDRLDHSTNTTIIVTTATGSVMAASNASDQFTCESVLSLDQRPDLSRQVELDTVDGEAAICLVSDTVPSTSHLIASTGDRHVNATADVRFEAVRRPPLLLAVGEIGIGLSGPGQNATDGARRVDGLASIFYQNSPSKKDLLTVAVRSKGTVNSAAGNNGLFGFDPAQSIYPVMGDASTHQELGQSASRVYVRYDRGRSHVMYGDLHGDTADEGRSGLLEYNRNVTGFRFQVQNADPTNWIQGQVARPKTGYMRDITSAQTGSAIRLSQIEIVPGSESITLEIRDRRNPERILSRETLVRNVDYSLDPLSGTLFMMRPVSLFDSSLNLVQIVSTYEYQAIGVSAAMVLGRGSYSVNRIGLRLGASMLSQNEGGETFSIGGLELEQKLLHGGRFKAEIPVSNGRLLTDTIRASNVNRNGKAIRAEIEQPLGLRNSVLRGRYAKTDEGFFNPYGSIAVQGQQSQGISVETRGLDSGRLTFSVEQEINRNSAVDNQRKTVSAKLMQALGENLTLEAGIDHRAYENHTTGQQIDSELISAGLKWKPLSRLETSIRREQNLREADPTYPSQTLLGVQYQLTPSNRIFATQRFSSAPITPIGGAENSGVLSPQSTRETAIGVESRLLKNTNLTTNYRMDTSGTGTDSFAVLGVLTRLPIRPGLSFDWTLDNAVHLSGPGKGYVGGSFGFTQSKDDRLRISSRFEMRRADTTQKIFTAGIVGRLSTSTSAMARYRVSNYAAGAVGGIAVGRVNDGLLALAVRPKTSDRVAVLFSYEFGNGNAAATPAGVSTLGRTDRLSADALIRIGHGFEFYSRVAEARTSSVYGGSRLGTYLQGRLQKSLSRRFDIAGETRWIRESVIAKGALIIGAEWGTWLTQDFRVGLGYSSRGFANPGALLNSTAARGGPYVVLTSSLSSIFDLMGSSSKSK